MRAVLFIVLLLLPFLVEADSCIQDSLEQIVAQVRSDDWFLPSDQSKIDAVHANPNLTIAEKAEQSFDAYLEARIRNLPEDDQLKVLKLVMEAKTRAHKKSVNGAYNPYLLRIRLSLPSSMQHNALEWAILAHEIEHGIQHLKAGFFVRSLLAQATTRFLMEEGAMVSELKYLKTIPHDERLRLAAELEAQPLSKLDKKSRKLAIQMLSFSENDVDRYLALQREAGRYSETDILKAKYLPLIPVLALAGALIGTGQVCDTMSRELQNEPSFFYDKICHEHMQFPERPKPFKSFFSSPQH